MTAERGLLNTRLTGLQAALASSNSRLRSYGEREAQFKARAMRLLGAELPATSSILDTLRMLHQRMRELERNLDHEAVARERIAGLLAAAKQSRYAVGLGFYRRLRRVVAAGLGIASHSKEKPFVW